MDKTTSEMKLMPIDKLVPYANNARTHSAEQITKLRSSLCEFGFINPVIIDKNCGILAGMESVPCVFAEHLTEAQKKAYILADTRCGMGRGDAAR